MSYSH